MMRRVGHRRRELSFLAYLDGETLNRYQRARYVFTVYLEGHQVDRLPLRCPFTRAEGAEGHCEGMAAVVF